MKTVLRTVLPVVAAIAVTWGIARTTAAQSSIPNGVFVRNSEGLVWLVLEGERIKIPVWQASDEEIAAVPVFDRWAVMDAVGAIVAGDRPAWLAESSPPAAPPAARAEDPTPTPRPAEVPGSPSFGTGVKVVGVDIQPGTYRSNNSGGGCYWARLKGLGGGLDDVLANDNAQGPAVVTIHPSDKGFTSSRCATWVMVTGPITASQTAPFGDGTWIVGTDIAPGLWRAEPSSTCYWQRSGDFDGGINSIIANENARGSAVVQIARSDKGFISKRCGTWTKAD